MRRKGVPRMEEGITEPKVFGTKPDVGGPILVKKTNGTTTTAITGFVARTADHRPASRASRGAPPERARESQASGVLFGTVLIIAP